MNPTKVVVLKLRSPRRPSPGPQDATDAGLQSEVPPCAWRVLGRQDLSRIIHSHDAWTDPILNHSIARLN
jgi:hypothetical protein